jgi:hypothetical protein
MTESTDEEGTIWVARARREEVIVESTRTFEDAGRYSSFRAERSHCRGWSSHMSSMLL